MKSSKPTKFRLNRDSPLAYGLVLWLPMHDGRLVDHVRGTVFTPAVGGPYFENTLYGRASAFFNDTDNVLYSTITPVTAAPLTISCWYRDNLASTKELISVADSASAANYFSLASLSSSTPRAVRMRVADGTTTTTSTSVGILAEEWGLATMSVISAADRTVYVNGGNGVRTTTSRTPTSIDRIGIGALANNSPGSLFSGWISDVCIWDRALPATEIAKLYDPSTRWELYEPVKKQFFVAWAGASGPQTFFNTPGGTLTPAGAVSKLSSKTQAGTLTPTGTDTKRTSKAHGGTITPTGVLAALRIILLSLAGTLTPAGALVKRTAKTWAGTITPTGADAKHTTKSWAGSLTPTGTLARRTLKALAGTVTATGDLVRRTNKALAGTLTSAGSVAKHTAKYLAGSVTPTGALAVVRAFILSIGGTLTPTGTLAKRTGKLHTGGLDLSGNLARKTIKALAGTITPAGAHVTNFIIRAIATVFLTLPRRSLSLTVAARNQLTLTRRRLSLTLAPRNILTLARRRLGLTLGDK